MKHIICLGDGMADEPIEILGGKTPLEFAHTPNMDFIASSGELGLVHTVPEGLSPGSDVTNMGILGYDPRTYYTGRGPIEAAAMKLQVPTGLMVFRCNLVCIQDGVMKDFTAGHISTEEADQLMNELNQKLGSDQINFITGVSYRHIALLSDKFSQLTCCAPHDITDKRVDTYLPSGENDKGVLELMESARQILLESEVNKTRVKNGKLPATDIWPWSQGLMPKLPSFKDTFNKTGGIVTAVDLLKGLATLTGLEAPSVVGATGFIDTNYQAKVDATLELLDDHDFAYLHVEAPDECGHMGDAKLKSEAIEAFDAKIVGPMLDYQKQNPDTRILVLPDHPTPCAIKTHTSNPVPYVMSGVGVTRSHNQSEYTEIDAEKTGVIYSYPWELLSAFFN